MTQTMNIGQELCKLCGLCCDGTLFDRTGIINSEDRNVAESLKMIIIDEDQGPSFKQPCPHFNSDCSVYNTLKRPHICGAYECKLLKKFKKNEVEIEPALALIRKTKSKAVEIRNIMRTFDELRDISTIVELGWTMNDRKRCDSEEVLFRKKYKHILILIFTLNETLNRHFRNLNEEKSSSAK